MRKWEDPALNEKLIAGTALDTPLYKEVKRLLTRAVMAGEWKPGAAIPSERLLAERFHLAVGTVRKAVDELVQENILLRQHGRGTFVTAHNLDRQMFHFFHIMRSDGGRETPVVEMLSFRRRRGDQEETEGLGRARGAGMFRIRNLLSLGGRPVMLDDIAIPQALFPGLTARQFRNRPNTIYHLYQTAFGINVVRSAERLRARLADAETAGLLRVDSGDPLLEIRRVAMTFNDAPVEFRRSLVNTAEYEYFNKLAKGDRG